jgi:uncharacterized membrane protein YjjP (DUF1212 family)
METLIVLISSTVFSALGWWIGDFIGMGTAFVLSIVGTAVGVYLGRRFVQDYLP